MINKQKFLVDAMLGNIARKLRLFGFDCKYFSAIEDEQLLPIAKNEDRIIITKDHNVANVCKKQNVSVIELIGQNEVEQIVAICKKISLDKCKIDMNNIRCTLCNGTIRSTSKEKIIDRIPLRVAENMEQFWICDSCSQIYWEGTHIRNLQEFIGEINERL